MIGRGHSEIPSSNRLLAGFTIAGVAGGCSDDNSIKNHSHLLFCIRTAWFVAGPVLRLTDIKALRCGLDSMDCAEAAIRDSRLFWQRWPC